MLNTIGRFDERVLQHLDVPFRRVYLHPPSTFRLEVADDGSFHDEWGVGYRPMGPYNERVGHPLAQATLADLEHFPWLDPHDPGRVEGLADEARRLYEDTDYSLVAGAISAGIFQDCWNLRGMEQFMADLKTNREFAEELLDQVTVFHIGMWRVFLDTVGEYVDIVETADDLAGQRGTLISPQMYREIIKPRHAELNRAIRESTQARILYHSCGAVMPLIDDLIEIGVDILNPIQVAAKDMETDRLKAEFGNEICFWGAIDTQHVLPFGDKQAVEEEVKKRIADLAPGGGYILAPSHNIQAGVPPENVVCMYDSALQHGHYPI